MFKDFIKQEAGSGTYGIISLCIFSLFFLILLIQVFRYTKAYIAEVSHIPLEDNESNGSTENFGNNR